MKFEYRKLLPILLVIFTCAYFLAFIYKYSFYAIDDAFIHLRIARNIVERGTPYFNVDEQVLGSSPHLWINLLALGLKIFGGNVSFVPYLSWIFTAGAFLCCTQILQERYSQINSILLSTFLVLFLLIPSAAGLMETPLAIFLFLLTLILLKRKFLFYAGACAGALLWVRIEYTAFIPLVFLLLDSRDEKRHYSVGVIVSLAVYVAYCTFYFGTLIPFPALAKPVVYSVNILDLITEMPTSTNYRMIVNRVITREQKFVVVVISLVALFSTLAFWFAKRKKRDIALLSFLFSTSVLVIYIVKGVYIFTWYTPLFTVPLALSILFISPKKLFFTLSVLFKVSFVNVFIIGCLDQFAFLTKKDYYYDEFSPGWRVQQYHKAAKSIYEKYPNAVLMTSEIGALGWSFPGKIIDAAALVSPETLKYHPLAIPEERPWSTAGAIPKQAVIDMKPDFIISMPTFGRSVFKGVHDKILPYELINKYPIVPPEYRQGSNVCCVWGSDGIYVFKRISGQAP